MPSSPSPPVAIIIPCWNAEKWVARAIRSALDVGYPNLEVIVIDDGSTDGSLDVIRSLGNRIRWETGPNRGACAARNRGLALSSAEYVLFLDADDYLEAGSITNWIAAAEGSDVVFGPCRHEPNGRRITFPVTSNGMDIMRLWLQNHTVAPCSVLWRKSFLFSLGGWDEAIWKNQDGELVIRAMIEGAHVRVSHAGCGIYDRQYSRISKTSGRHVLEHQLEVFSALRSRAKQRGLDIDEAFGPIYYLMAVSAFSASCDDIGYAALREAHRLGVKSHVGGRLHRTFSVLLGLRNTVRLRNAIQQIERPGSKRVKNISAN